MRSELAFPQIFPPCPCKSWLGCTQMYLMRTHSGGRAGKQNIALLESIPSFCRVLIDLWQYRNDNIPPHGARGSAFVRVWGTLDCVYCTVNGFWQVLDGPLVEMSGGQMQYPILSPLFYFVLVLLLHEHFR